MVYYLRVCICSGISAIEHSLAWPDVCFDECGFSSHDTWIPKDSGVLSNVAEFRSALAVFGV